MDTALVTKTSSLRSRTIKALLLGIVALGTSSLATAGESVRQPTLAAYQATAQAKLVSAPSHAVAGNRVDWNVDYPSQLAPQPVTSARDAESSKLASSIEDMPPRQH